MSNFDTNKIYAKTSAALARERFLWSEASNQVQIEAATITGYVVEIRHTQTNTELLLDSFQAFSNVEVDALRLPKLTLSPFLRRKFERLATKWKSETFMISSLTEIASHPSYQQIIGMGSDVLPLIFEDLAVSGAKWYWALIAITGEDPVSPEQRGQIDRMNAAWLEWGTMQGYV